MGYRNILHGRYFGIFNVEGDGGPIAMFSDRASADGELDRRRRLDPEHDDHLGQYHQVFACDIVGLWWNSYDPDPREDSPLSFDEVVAGVVP